MTREVRHGAALGAGLGLVLSGLLMAGCLSAGRVPARGDLPDFFWPMKAYTASRWQEGSPALWNPLSGCGEPWMAQLQTGVFYPPDLVFLLPWPSGPLASISFHVVLAAAGFAAWLTRLGASRSGALCGAALFAGAGPFLSLVPVFNNACSAAWLPWQCLGALAAAATPGPSGIAGLALATAFGFLAGEPSIAAAGAVVAAVLALASRRTDGPRATSERTPAPMPSRGIAISKLVFGGLLSFGLAAIVAIPFAHHIGAAGRLSAITLDQALARPVEAGDLVDLLIPPSRDATRAAVEGRGGYLISLALGPMAFLLVAGAGWQETTGRRTLLLALASLFLLGFAMALGARGVLLPLLYKLSLYRGLRFPARWFVLSHVALSALAGLGLDGWVRREPEPDRPAPGLLRAAFLWASAALVLGIVTLGLFTGHLTTGRDGVRLATVLVALAFGLATIALFRRGLLSTRIAGACLVLAVAVPLPFVASDPLESVPAADLVKKPSSLRGLSGMGRIYPSSSSPTVLVHATRPDGRWTIETPRRSASILAGYSNLRHGLPTVTSASPIVNRSLEALIGSPSREDPVAPLALANVRHVVSPFPIGFGGFGAPREASGVYQYDLPKERVSGRAFFARRTRSATDEEARRELFRAGFDPGALAFVEGPDSAPHPSPGPSRASFSIAQVTVDRPETMEIETSCGQPSFLVLTRAHDPGWRATRDGNPIALFRTNLAFLGLWVPAGESRVVLTYEPPGFGVGIVMTFVSIVLTILVAVLGRRSG